MAVLQIILGDVIPKKAERSISSPKDNANCLYDSTQVAQRYKEMENDHIERFIQILKDGKKEGVFRDDINPLIIAPLYVGQMESLKKTKYMLLEKYPAVEIFDSIFFNFIRGIATLKGLEIIDNFIQENNRKQK